METQRARPKKMRLISIRLPQKLLDEIDKMAIESNITMSEVIRTLLFLSLYKEYSQKYAVNSGGKVVRGVKASLICKVCGYELATISFGKSMHEIAKLLSQANIRCPRCNSNRLSIILTIKEQ